MNAPRYLSESQAKFLGAAGLAEIFALVRAAGGEIRVNGGAVRNALMGAPVDDIDLSTTLSPNHAAECLMRGGVKVVPTGVEHGTITAVFEGHGYEVTTLREDVETDGRRAVVRFGKNWQADAKRRDFTINALYCDLERRIYDPLGGYEDIVARTVRFIGDPDQRIIEDRLRILRFFRFFAWYGASRPDSASLKACIRQRQGLERLSSERVWREIKKLLTAPDPVRAILWMRTSRILSLALPESDGWGVDLLPALVATCNRAGERPDPLLRVMALVPPRSEPVETLSTRLKLSNEESVRLRRWAESLPPSPKASDAELAKLLYRNGRQPVLDHLRLERARLNEADSPLLTAVQEKITFASAWRKPEFPLRGQDLLACGHRPGPEMGRLLGELEQEWIASGFKLDRQALLERAMRGR
jgi:poly(A) polymerase